ncbi:MAG: hypothetical protein ACD_49C00079G0018 [uncultured bacterium (gcode 4)]|uniref:Methyltransferase type 12 n=1 Tax=uncultured bacterium (gcode 4) TaxID=1234023 RepID=K2BUD2_9BACT|nr:MAG: hypothetical protein ACD_49C00079G0018 [uncultured bacterium (gcode 4)]
MFLFILLIKVILASFYFIIILLTSFYLIGSFIAIIQTKWVPYVPSYDKDIATMKEKLKLENTWSIIDLGCWDGKALRFFVKNYWFKKAVGYDLNLPAILFWKFLNKNKKIKNVKLINKNFIWVDLAWYDYVFVYLLTEYLVKIEDYVFSSIGDNTIIISNAFKFKKHEPFEIIKDNYWKDRFMFYKKSDLYSP